MTWDIVTSARARPIAAVSNTALGIEEAIGEALRRRPAPDAMSGLSLWRCRSSALAIRLCVRYGRIAYLRSEPARSGAVPFGAFDLSDDDLVQWGGRA